MTNQLLEIISQMKADVADCKAAKTETIGSPSVGDVVRQGDVYLVCLNDDVQVPSCVERQLQLAPGTTQGSRHVLNGKFTSKQLAADEVNKLDPEFKVHQELCGMRLSLHTDCELDHPEHGNKILPANTEWGVVYQLAFADEIRRVRD